MDYDSIQKAGSGDRFGAVIVMDETTCMVKRACQRISRFYYAESCGQCTPCREGHGLDAHVDAHRRGQADAGGPRHAQSAAAGQIEGHTICAFGEAAAWRRCRAFLRHFWHEFEYAIVNKRFLVDDERAGTVVKSVGMAKHEVQ